MTIDVFKCGVCIVGDVENAFQHARHAAAESKAARWIERESSCGVQEDRCDHGAP